MAWPAAAQQISDCDVPEASARHVLWNDPTRTFANDQIRLVALDAGDEETPSAHILVTFPEADGPGCRLISAPEGSRYATLSMRRAAARYGGQGALNFGVPGTLDTGAPVLIEFVVDRVAGTLTIP